MMKKNRPARHSMNGKIHFPHPLENIRSIAQAMAHAFEGVETSSASGKSSPLSKPGLWHPHVAMRETPFEVVISAELPGVAKKDLHVNVAEDSVIIFAERNKEYRYKGRNEQGAERSYQLFSRTLTLPVAVNADQAKASLKDGLLEIRLFKSQKSPMRQISMEQGGVPKWESET